MAGEINVDGMTDSAKLVEIAKFAIASDEANSKKTINGGAGRIGMINGRVVKFNTHIGERLRGPSANQAMRDSCNQLRETLFSIAGNLIDAKTANGAATLAKIRKSLKLNSNGQAPANAKLLDRTVVAEVVNLIGRHTGEDVWSKMTVGQVQALKSTDKNGKAIDTRFGSIPEIRVAAMREELDQEVPGVGLSRGEVVIRDKIVEHSEFRDREGDLNGVGSCLFTTAKSRVLSAMAGLDAAGQIEYMTNYEGNVRDEVEFLASLCHTVKEDLLCRPEVAKVLNAPCSSGEPASERLVELRNTIVLEKMLELIFSNAKLDDSRVDFTAALDKIGDYLSEKGDFETWVHENTRVALERAEIAIRFEDELASGQKIKLPPSFAEDVAHSAVAVATGHRTSEKLAALGGNFAKIFTTVSNANGKNVDKTMQTFHLLMKEHITRPDLVDYSRTLAVDLVNSGLQIPKTMTPQSMLNFCHDFTDGVLERMRADEKGGNHDFLVDIDFQNITEILIAVAIMLRDVSPAFVECIKMSDGMQDAVSEAHRVMEELVRMTSRPDKEEDFGKAIRTWDAAFYGRSVASLLLQLKEAKDFGPDEPRLEPIAQNAPVDEREAVRIGIRNHFKEACMKNGRCDLDELEKSSLRHTELDEGFILGFETAAADDTKVTENERALLLRIAKCLPEDVTNIDGLQLDEATERVQTAYSIAKGVAAELGLLKGEDYVDHGKYNGEARKIDFDGVQESLQAPGPDTSVPDAFRNEIASVKDNPGAGHCFFYSALEFDIGGTANSETHAKELRAKLISHAEYLLNGARQTGDAGPGIRVENIDGTPVWSVPTTGGYITINEAVKQVCEEEAFKKSGYADLTNAAFLADMLKRPVVVYSQRDPTTAPTTYRFDCELSNGQRLEGEPIYILHTGQHFRAVRKREEG